MTEAAVLSVPFVRVRILFEKHHKNSKTLLFIKEHIHSAVATIVVLNNAINIIGAIFVGQMALRIFGSHLLGIFSAVLTMAIIVISEVVPKTIGEHYKVQVSLLTAPVLRALMWIFSPLIKILALLMHPFSSKSQRPWVTEEEIKILLRLGRAAGTVETDEETLINRVFKLNDLTARQMMRPIDSIYALDGDKTIAEERDKIISAPFSRIAVYEKAPENITGISQHRILLREMANDNYDAHIKNFISKPIFVNENERADALLDKFRSYHQHLFIVRDPKAGNIGVVTMEDVLEELFGEIYDEKDAARGKK